MQTLRITIPLTEAEYDALVRMAQQDYRHPRGQIRFLLCEEARRRKLLDVLPQPDSAESERMPNELATTA